MSINQLLAKALSTTSEDEAMACLRMARKRGGKLEDSSAPVEYNGHDAKYWYDKAYKWYHQAKAQSDGLTQEQQNSCTACTKTKLRVWLVFAKKSERLRSRFVLSRSVVMAPGNFQSSFCKLESSSFFCN